MQKTIIRRNLQKFEEKVHQSFFWGGGGLVRWTQVYCFIGKWALSSIEKHFFDAPYFLKNAVTSESSKFWKLIFNFFFEKSKIFKKLIFLQSQKTNSIIFFRNWQIFRQIRIWKNFKIWFLSKNQNVFKKKSKTKCFQRNEIFQKEFKRLKSFEEIDFCGFLSHKKSQDRSF